jgi:hypothetical protein
MAAGRRSSGVSDIALDPVRSSCQKQAGSDALGNRHEIPTTAIAEPSRIDDVPYWTLHPRKALISSRCDASRSHDPLPIPHIDHAGRRETPLPKLVRNTDSDTKTP